MKYKFLSLKSTVVTVCATCFEIQNLCIFLTQCMCLFHMTLGKNNDYVP